jgi:hypothetical protein
MVAGGRAEAWVGEERICLRDAGELAACFAAQAGSLFGYACVLTRGERALADDLVQAAFEAAAREWAIAVATEPCSTNPVPKATEVLRVYSVATGRCCVRRATRGGRAAS